ncbi:EAL domain-containing protein [Polymorphobacter sp. PAMC 29334]|uniref:putative bifunctional diguanylate cyclase/phosphodiesterase n=1 Tax=Polymorphobacter sp. PAMC 29334 TaxID=2862331 RepID=UPI001C768663|nr:EAL domain-containing protein [Polymorphobacter sp. PAMC 29334]QYE36358.1 EAL domain-containing protein [Polymorphobacter sp. PAMC 29334]
MQNIAEDKQTFIGPQPRSAALPEMATAVLIVDEGRQVEYVNASARELFLPVEPIGCTLTALFTSCGATGGDEVFAGVDSGVASTPVRLRLTDDRLLDCTLRPLSSGGFVLSMDDVTTYVRNAEMAERDALTGLANRKALRDRLVERLTNVARTGQATALLYIDLDRFKAVNDTLGHPIGDTLLRKVAERFKSATRDGDIVARLGGDEFAVIQSDTPQPAGAQALATRLVDLIGRAYAIDGHLLHIGASVGVAIAPIDGREPDVLLKNADLALYRAKAEGRGCYRMFAPEMAEHLPARRLLETDLRRALALKQMQLLYQPQYDLASNVIIGFEALIRWHHPTRGVVPPEEVIPLAEEIGIIGAIGEWVLRTACKQAAAWPVPVTIAVNLSPVQFRGGRLAETVTSALAQSQLDAHRLELEITEGALLNDTSDVLKTLNRLREVGVAVTMDDFGTGYSSLGYLQKFPFDKIKIDQCFVRDIDSHVERQAIFRAVTGLAAALRMKTIAEGVETEGELACVRAAGCDEVQGYLTGRPISAEATMALLASTCSAEAA